MTRTRSERGAGREAQVADDRDVEAVAAQERLEPQVHVGLRVERAAALEAERIAGELDRVQIPQPVRDRERQVDRVERRLDPHPGDVRVERAVHQGDAAGSRPGARPGRRR